MLDRLRSGEISSGGQKFGQKFRPPRTSLPLFFVDRVSELTRDRDVGRRLALGFAE
jgi:hypothetical protein